jgi:ABC-type antimicrobial peptide transport system permease subunit
MTRSTLIWRSLRFHARSHLGAVLGAVIGSAVLIGALVVGDSVRQSLRDLALSRLGKVEFVLAGGDRFFREQLANDLKHHLEGEIAPVLQISGIAVSGDGSARANRVQILGVDERFWKLAEQAPTLSKTSDDIVMLNQPLAAHLHAKAGDTILVRVQKPSLLSREIPLASSKDASIALRLKVTAIVSEAELGRFSLPANQSGSFNVFLPLKLLQEKLEEPGRANLALVSSAARLRGQQEFLATPGFVPKVLESQWRRWNSKRRAAWLRRNFLTVTLVPIFRVAWSVEDGELEIRQIADHPIQELRSRRVFIDPPVVDALSKDRTLNSSLSHGGDFSSATKILTYFVNELRVADRSTPYSMVTAINRDIVPGDLHDDEIVVNQWLADDLQAKPGDSLSLKYFMVRTAGKLEERTNSFRIHSIIPLAGAAADRDLMPDFPGLAKAESSHDWDTGFPIDLKKIREKDEQYWKQYRGTPKAFVTLAAGQKMWANRFGELTAIRFPADAGWIVGSALKNLDPATLGLQFQPVREQALKAADESEDFGGLFLGFSFFLIVAALILMALLFQLGLEQRAGEVGMLLAVGFRPKQIRRLLLLEGCSLAFVGGVVGAVAGLLYARGMLWGLKTIWKSAVANSALEFHATASTLAVGLISSVLVSVVTLWLTLRKQARHSPHELLSENFEERDDALEGDRAGESSGRQSGFRILLKKCSAILPHKRYRLMAVAVISGLGGLGLIGWAITQSEAEATESFFGGGSMLLISGICLAGIFLRKLGGWQSAATLTLGSLAVRGCARRRKRSVATIALLASGTFLIVAVAANRLEAGRDSVRRSSGTGGFALVASATVPVIQNLNEKSGRESFGLDEKFFADVRFVSMRVHDGDEASCLNLNRAQSPRLLGVKPELLQERKAFTFASLMPGLPTDQPWRLLQNCSACQPDEVPAIGDINSIRWALHKKVGDALDYTDERGKKFTVRIIGAVANSILQGSLIVNEDFLLEHFPSETGYRMFLIDAPSKAVTELSATLSRAMEDVGLELTPATERLAAFNAVQNTYLNTFQVLGGLGLLLGSAGLGIVVLRNVLERRGELALLLAVGFPRRRLSKLVLWEHAALLWAGLGLGVASALAAVLPALLSPASQFPVASLAATLGFVFVSGMLWTWLATRTALRGELLAALRNE